MAFQPPPLPSFQTQIPAMPNALDQYAKAAQLKNMLSENALRQQLAPSQVQEAQQKAQQSTIQTQMEQANLDSQKALQQAVASGAFNKFAGVETPDGSGFDAAGAYSKLLSDHPEILPAHASAAVESLQKIGQTAAETQKAVAQTGEATATARTKGMKVLADKIGSILDLPSAKASAALDALKQDLVKNPKAYAGVSQQDLAHVYSADLEHLPAMANLIGLESQIADFHKSKAEAAKAEQGVIPEGGAVSPETRQQVQKDVAIATNPQIQQGKVAVAAAEGKARAEAQASLLQGSALDQSAQRYLESGQLPAGMRSPGMAAAIINRAGELGGGQNIAGNQAAFKANQASYENVTKTLDTLSGFESAAVKNIDMFKGLVSKLPDTGVPWINKPLRTLDEKVVGAEWMPAINAAREIANREVARVTNDPKLSGVLSDSARQEVSSLNPKDATLAQIMHVTDLMKQDMANVHSSLSMQKADIGKRLGVQTQAENQQGGGGAAATGMIRARDLQGVLHEAKAGTSLPPGWKLEK